MPTPDAPLYNGLAIFGIAPIMTVAPEPVELQINAYPGIDGLEMIRLGGRGGRTSVSGTLVGTSPSDLAAQEQTWRVLQQAATPWVLVDTLGTAWSSVVLVSFAPQGRAEVDSYNVWSRDYTAEFLHLV